MAGDFTFSMIKPDAVERGLIGKILLDVEENGFKIEKMRLLRLTLDQAENFYISLGGFPFFYELCTYMSSGQIVALVLRKENAVSDFRELIGATNPLEARIGTIRKKFGIDKGKNSIHGSDSDENAKREASFFDL